MKLKSLCALAAFAALFVSGCVPTPHLAVSTNTLRYDASETVKTFEVFNDGDADTTLTVAFEVSEPWVTIQTTGTTSTGEDNKITVTVTIDRNFSTLKADPAFATALITVTAGEEKEEVLVTTAPDYFTQFIENGDDLDGTAITFRPNGGPNFYDQTNSPITGFPTAPGGQVLDFSIFSDPVRAGLLDGRQVAFYDQRYDTMWISSQGWVSFGETPGPNPNDFASHFSVPRLSALPVDATGANSTVSLQQDNAKVVISYEDANTPGTSSPNDFQIELFFDGTIRLSYVDVDPTIRGVVGLSVGGFEGTIPDDFVPTDLGGANTAPLKALAN